MMNIKSKNIIMNNLSIYFTIGLWIITMLQGPSAFSQENNPWEIAVDPAMPYLTTIEVDNKTMPFLNKVEKIWDESKSGLPYNAFTDLIRFQGNWYCTFREAEVHKNHDSGRCRVIRSSDGKVWESSGLFEWDGGDVRELKFSITAEGRLMGNTSVFFISRQPYQRQSVTWLSSDGNTWSDVYACSSGINTWRWAVTWNKGIGYSIGYSGKDGSGTLYTTRDGKTWEVLAENIFPGGYGNEASIVFGEDNKAFCLLRDGGVIPTAGTKRTGHLGTALPPYTEWTWTDLGKTIGGPKMIRLKDGRFLAGVRLHGKTILVWIDPEKGIMKEFLVLPSGGQGGTSYPGIVEHDGMIWISYYSGHEYPITTARTYDSSPCAIYLAKIKLTPKP